MAFKKFEHDPGATLDYSIEWEDWLDSDNGETITDCSWSVTPHPDNETSEAEDTTPVTVIAQTLSPGGDATTVWLEGGTAGNNYIVTAHVTSDSTPIQREDERSIELKVRER